MNNTINKTMELIAVLENYTHNLHPKQRHYFEEDMKKHGLSVNKTLVDLGKLDGSISRSDELIRQLSPKAPYIS